MALLGFGKKKEETKEPPCCCAETRTPEAGAEPVCACQTDAPAQEAKEGCCGGAVCGVTSMQVLGAGCKSCHELYENCRDAVSELGMKLEVEYITDMEKVMAYGVMSMPAVTVNGKVVSAGRVLKKGEIISLLKKLGYCG